MKKLLFIILIVAIATSQSWAATYTVTQDGSGADYSAATFNALNSNFAGDTFYFSGTFTTQIDPGDSFGGSDGNPVILDGWQAGSYNATDGNHTNLSSLAKLTASSSSGAMEIKGNDYITIQDFQFDGEGSDPVGLLVWDTTGGDAAVGITVRDTYIHSYTQYGLWLSVNNSGGDFAVQKFTFGGASGDGNEVYDCSTSTSYHETRAVELSEGIYSYNMIHNNDATRNYGTGGLTFGNSLVAYVEKVLVEYNYIANQNYNTTSGEVGFGGKGKNNFIIRFNKIVNNIDSGQGIGLHTGYDSQYMYVYGNWIEANTFGGGPSTGGSTTSCGSPCNANGVDTLYQYYFSNVVWKNTDDGLFSSEWESPSDVFLVK